MRSGSPASATYSHRGSGQGDAGGWPSTTPNPSGGGRSNNVGAAVTSMINKKPENDLTSKEGRINAAIVHIQNDLKSLFAVKQRRYATAAALEIA